VVGHRRLVGLARAERGRQGAAAAQDDAVQDVADHGHAVGADAGEVALDDVALAAVIDLDAGAVEADHVAGASGGAADGVAVAAGDRDAEQEVAGGGAGQRSAGADGDRAGAGRVDADEVALDDVAGGGPGHVGGQGADDVDAVQAVTRTDVAQGGGGAADRVV